MVYSFVMDVCFETMCEKYNLQCLVLTNVDPFELMLLSVACCTCDSSQKAVCVPLT